MRDGLKVYYLATIVFLALDYLFGWNIRVAFLDDQALARLGYYAVCFACLGLVVWRPEWSAIVAASESLFSVSCLVLGMGMKVMMPSAMMLEAGRAPVTTAELINFLISGSIGYMAWKRGFMSLKESKTENKDPWLD